jgi:hypothetical protein
MKTNFSIIVLASLFLFLEGATQDTQVVIDNLLQQAKQSLAPDRRTVVFDVAGRFEGNSLVLTGEVHSKELHDRLTEFLKSRQSTTIVDSLSVLPQTRLGDKLFAVVSLSVANLRTKPAHAAEMATQALLGTPLKILKREGGWYYVQTPEEYLGWTSDMLKLMNAEEFDRWERTPKLIVKTSYGFTRKTEQADGPVVSDVVVGCILGLRRETGTHVEVEYPDGRTAFLPKQDCERLTQWIASAKDTPESILATARQFVGIPYLWGGTSAKGFDCSGFTKTVYFLNGVLLPRDANQQAAVGEPIDLSKGRDQLKPGDVLFFGAKATADRPERVTHCGISLGGKRFIHESGDVRFNSLDSLDVDYSASRDEGLVRARRFIGASESTGIRRLSQFPYYRQ